MEPIALGAGEVGNGNLDVLGALSLLTVGGDGKAYSAVGLSGGGFE